MSTPRIAPEEDENGQLVAVGEGDGGVGYGEGEDGEFGEEMEEEPEEEEPLPTPRGPARVVGDQVRFLFYHHCVFLGLISPQQSMKDESTQPSARPSHHFFYVTEYANRRTTTNHHDNQR